jgi:prepilin-type N-terminal cleavage/methylation domain-containing protein
MKKRNLGTPSTVYNLQSAKSGFTIVEILVVIVIIGILAALTIFSYIGFKGRTIMASLKSDLTNASGQLKLYEMDKRVYPITYNCPALTDSQICLKASPGTTIEYIPNNSTAPKAYCINATKGGQSLRMSITQDGKVLAGVCPILSYDASNPVSYPGSGTSMFNLGGNYNNGTFNGSGVSYSKTDGALGFDGTAGEVDFGDITSLGLGSGSFTVSIWFKEIASPSPYWPMLVDTGGSGTSKGFYLRNLIDGGNLALILNDGTNKFEIYPIHITVPNEWVMYTAVVNREEDLAYPYINGAVYTSKVTDIRILGDITPSCHLEIAESESAYMLNGQISSVKIYNKALTADEVKQNFETLRGRYGL